MRKIFLTMTLLLAFTMAMFAEKQVVTLYVPDMECNNCKAKVDNVLAFEKGVRKLDYDVAQRIVTITFEDKKTNTENLQNALVKYLNYKSQVISKNGVAVQNNTCSKPCDKPQVCPEDHKHDETTDPNHKGCGHNHNGCTGHNH